MTPIQIMQFSIEKPPHAALADVVQRFWQVDRQDPAFNKETIIPKGSAELIFNLYESDVIGAKIGDTHFRVPRCFISGFNTLPIELDIWKRQTFFGIFINPTAVRKLFPIRADEYANRCIDLTLLDRSIDSLWHQLAEEQTFDQRVAALTGWMLKRLPAITRHEKLFDYYLTNAIDPLDSASQVSEMLHYSPRHLSRKLHDLTGMNLEQTLIYKRYLSAADLMHRSDFSLTHIAHKTGYSDQSHLSKTFRSFAGMTPKAYRARKSSLSGHIFENVR